MPRCAAEEFDLGWLERACQEAHIDVCASHDRSFFSFNREIHEQQLSTKDIEQLAERLEKRFQSWTGFSLADYRARR